MGAAPGRPFYIVGVFAQARYAGNHLAVVRQARGCPDAELQAIARDIGPAAFVLSDTPERGGWPVRIFTPTVELPFSGHPTVGAAYVIQRELLREPVDTLVVDLPGGRVPVALTRRDGEVERLTMRQQDATFGQTLSAGEVAAVLGLEAADVDERYPVEEASTGLGYVMVPLRTLAALRRARPAEDRCAALVRPLAAKAFTLFCPETVSPERQLHVRVFASHWGVAEDPGTGTANGALGGYLARHRYFGSAAVDVTVEQGHGLGRPSLLHVRARPRGDAIEVHVGGPVVMVARGTLL